jgi:hypothetical protein
MIVRSPSDLAWSPVAGSHGLLRQARMMTAGSRRSILVLPQDFSTAHFMCAPGDQQLPQLTGGEMIRCTNMTTEGTWSAVVPTIHFPVSFKFANRTEQLQPTLDTLLVEPHADRMVLIWRAAARLGHRLVDLREVVVGKQAAVPVPEPFGGKLKFRSLSELVAWRRAEREEADS